MGRRRDRAADPSADEKGYAMREQATRRGNRWPARLKQQQQGDWLLGYPEETGGPMRHLFKRPSPAMIVACLSLFVALSGVTYAATGGNFILGNPNSAISQTALSAPIAGKALQVTNTSTGAGATALGLTVASGKAPFTVNSGMKVANLNADKIDGLDSTNYVRRCGEGSVLAYAYALALDTDWIPVRRGYTCLGDGIVRYRYVRPWFQIDFGYRTGLRTACPTLIVDGNSLGASEAGTPGALNVTGLSYRRTVEERDFFAGQTKCLAEVVPWEFTTGASGAYGAAHPFVVTLLGY
jgi:hypothetical protein